MADLTRALSTIWAELGLERVETTDFSATPVANARRLEATAK